MALVSPDKWLCQAFKLACFLHRDAGIARAVVARAALQLDVASAAQGKRLYYQPTGAARSKVYMSEPHLLQRLVYAASEPFERERETSAKPLQQSDLLISFIKHLVRITIKRNSFYVTLGLSRVLHNYTTGEAMEIYNLVVQDPERVHDDYYYRSRKGVLLKELKERFAPFVETVRATRGEERFRARTDAGRLAALAQECLEWFTPWATPCSVPECFDPFDDVLPQLHFTGRNPDEEHRIEVNRIHATLHPECFSRLAAANGYAPPDERLEIPFFAMAQDDSQAGPRQPPDASEEDLAAIKTSLAREEARRKAARCGVLRLLADGVEKARLDTAQTAQTTFAVDESAEIIEVYGRDTQGELLLAAHLLDWNATRRSAEMTLADGKKISFAIHTRQDEYGFPDSAEVTVACRVTGRARWRSFLTWPVLWKPALALGLLAVAATAAWFAWSGGPPAQGPVVKNAPGPVSAATPAEPPAPSPQTAAPAPANVNPEAPRPTPAPSVSRPVMKRPATPPRMPKPPAADVKTAPAPALARKEKASPQSNPPLTPRDDESANPRDAEALRGGWDVKLLGLPLSEIKLVTVQAVNEGPRGAELVTALTERLSAAGPRFVPAPDIAGAEGALKISLRPAAANGQIVVTAYLVNDQGRVVWPARLRASGRRYTGTPQDVAARIVADLVRAAQ